MKKMLLSLAVFAAFGASAQIYSENFSNPGAWTPATAWSAADIDGDTYTWGIYNLSTSPDPQLSPQGNAVLSFSWGDPDQGNSPTALTPDNWFISPPIDLTSSSTANFNYRVGALDGTYFAEHYAVYAVSDLMQLATATPIIEEDLVAGDTNLTTRSINVNSMTGAGMDSVYFVFRHFDVTDQYAILIDDISITSTPMSINENVISASVYPNPATEKLNITASEEVATVTITSMEGKVVATTIGASVDVAELNAGMYLYTATTVSGKVATGNFVKK